MPFVILPTNSVSGYTVKNSLRFNSGSSDYLSRTPASSGNRRTFTLSTWVKRSILSSGDQTLFGAHDTNVDLINFQSGDTIRIYIYNNSNSTVRIPSQLFRDPSAWYHFVFAFDTTNATAQNRCRIYVNGTEITSWSTNNTITQNLDCSFNQNVPQYIGKYTSGAYYNGYMSEIYMIDGQQLTPSSFGETDEDTGIWKPKAYTGTYGTNGFYLQFKNSSSLGTDSSGNGNTFTVNNLTSIDQTTDTPTNNFATFNSLFIRTTASVTYAEGNLKGTNSNATYVLPQYSTIGTIGSGKWYAEFKVTTVGSGVWVGILSPDDYADSNPNSVGYVYASSNGNKINYGTSSSYGSSFTSGDIIGVAFDAGSGSLTFYKNGTSQGSAFTTISTTLSWILGAGGYNGSVIEANFGNPPYSANSYTDGAGFGNFSYQPPANYFSLCTKNLATYG